jgi:hypothetical protein
VRERERERERERDGFVWVVGVSGTSLDWEFGGWLGGPSNSLSAFALCGGELNRAVKEGNKQS